MFIILLTYKKPMTEVERYMAEHLAYIDMGHSKDYFWISGAQNPRVGGVILSNLKESHQLKKILAEDPFYIHDVANYELIEFNPTKYHTELSILIKNQ